MRQRKIQGGYDDEEKDEMEIVEKHFLVNSEE